MHVRVYCVCVLVIMEYEYILDFAEENAVQPHKAQLEQPQMLTKRLHTEGNTKY